ncbi:MAG: hypothetical protein JW706_01500 [Opitutales bacterium]|nr:hypothetical protein [Opitutales bacterium]
MIQFLRRQFERLSTREQALLVAFLGVIALVWVGRAVSNIGSAVSGMSKVASDISVQKEWLSREADIESRLASVLKSLDSGETYSSNRLLGKLDEILRESDIKATLSRPVQRPGDVFVEHVVTVALEKVPMKNLIDFEQRMRSVFPYIGIEYLMIRPEPSGSSLLRGELRVTSFELAS